VVDIVVVGIVDMPVVVVVVDDVDMLVVVVKVVVIRIGHSSELFTISPFQHTYLSMKIFSTSSLGQSLLSDTMLPSYGFGFFGNTTTD